ncbi:MAG: hypothetical protein QGG40_19030, partial [Myxococcota bacterium]|nr:hypothetical protein [Myxococcota bacterium]
MRSMSILPVLLFIPVLAPSAAQACSPGLAELLATAPADGQTDIPTDARVRAFFGDGYPEALDMVVRVDGEVIDGELQEIGQTLDLVERFVNLEFIPTESFPEGSTVQATVLHEQVESTFTFQVGDQSGTAVQGIPDLEIDAMDEFAPRGVQSSCDYSRWRELTATVYPGEPDDHGLSLVHVYRSEAGSDPDFEATPFRTLVLEAGSDEPMDLFAEYPVDEDEARDCFVVVQEDGA